MKKSTKQPFLRFLFLCYCAALIWLLFFASRQAHYGDYLTQLKSNYNLRPFYTIDNYLWVLRHSASGYLVRHCTVNLLGNLFLFVPGGFLLPSLFPKMRPFWKFLYKCFFLLLLIEFIQLFSLLGRFDIDDMILNLAGLLAGYIIYLFRK